MALFLPTSIAKWIQNKFSQQASEGDEQFDASPNVYENLTGLSGVETFQRQPGSMLITFKGGGRTYNYPINATMEKLALRGYGLNGYLNRGKPW